MNDLFEKLDNLFLEYDSFVIVGHCNPDLDSYGASLAFYKIITNLNKSCAIYRSNSDYSDEMEKAFTKIGDVKYVDYSNIDYLSKSLLIVVDVQQKSRIEYPGLVDICKEYVVLDHHIKGKNCLKDAKLLYINDTMSSMVELMTYYLDYSDVEIDDDIATIMLAALEIATNDYNLKTTSRTYKAASKLVEMGADVLSKAELLKTSKDDYVKRADYIRNSYTANDNIAICVLPDIVKRETLAEVADSLLTFDNIEASFVIAKVNKEENGISARSLGDVDILSIVRRFNGGGSLTSAAAITKKNLREIKNAIVKMTK